MLMANHQNLTEVFLSVELKISCLVWCKGLKDLLDKLSLISS